MSKNSEKDKIFIRKRRKSVLLIIAAMLLATLVIIGILNLIHKSISKNDTNDVDTNHETVETIDSETQNENTETREEDTDRESEDSESSSETTEEVEETQAEEKSSFVNEFADLTYTVEEEAQILATLPEALSYQTTRYPEAKTTLMQYEKYKDNQDPIDISGDVAAAEDYDRPGQKVPYLNQWDKRWAFKMLDGGYFAIAGCGPTALTSVYTSITGDTSIDPFEMAQRAYDYGVYGYSYGSQHAIFTNFVNTLGLNGSYATPSFDNIKTYLDQGYHIVLNVQNNGIGDFTYGGHYIIVTGVDENNQFVILDPNSYNNTNQRWDPQRIFSQTSNMFIIWL